ncbi:hypothetical protein CK203_006312 [Vitis vinifera]|uniref:Uncharacterized protein n=1 Tax=Vitis vinifera TaxID=29760 RepID=A0A438KBG9_VITVI|nr:hypothetical protein CK203_006312 [Vitis vinifera]
MAALLYFEEKVHRKKLLRADAIPLLFPRLLCQILEHLGYPSEPQLERRRICREIFTLDKWTSMTTYGAELGAPVGAEHPEIPHPEQPEEPQLVEIPEVAPSAPPTTPQTPPVIPSISEPPPSSKPRIAISISEYRGICHILQALTTSQSILTQQIQHHMGMLSAPEHPIPILSEPTRPSQASPFVEQTMPSEEPTIGEAEASTPSIPSSAADPSFSHHHPLTI